MFGCRWQVLLLSFSLILFSESVSLAKDPACTSVQGGPCGCVLSKLEAALGSQQAQLIFQAWALDDRNEEKVRAFYAHNNSALNEALYRYMGVKYAISFQCGAMDIDDGVQE